MKTFNPYLCFKGRCEEALNFYKEALNGETLELQRYGDSPMATTEEQKNWLMHGELRAEGIVIMAADDASATTPTSGGAIHLNINFTDLAEQEKAFNALSAGGTIIMALDDTFWGARFGMFVDKFGIHWMMNCEKK